MGPAERSQRSSGRGAQKRFLRPGLWCFCKAGVDQALARGEERLVIVAHGGTQMAAMERFAVPHKTFHEWCGPNAGGYVLDTRDWAEKRVLHVVETVQYTEENS